MNTVFLRSLLFSIFITLGLAKETKLPQLFVFDPNFTENQAKENSDVYHLATVIVIGEAYQLPIQFEREMDRILKLSTSSVHPILERVSFSPENRSDMPAFLLAEHPGPFASADDAVRFQDGFIINLPGGQKMNTYFKSFITFKLRRGTIELRPSRNQLIRYKLKW